jgi:hypothetical protein
MRKSFLLLLLFCFSIQAFTQKQSFTVQEIDKDYYKWISLMSEGKTTWFEDPIDNVAGISYRFVITTSEIYNNIYVEKVTVGPEGGGRKIASKRSLPIDDIFISFNIPGERAGVEFESWQSPSSVVITIYKKRYLIEDIDKSDVLISEL